MNDRKHHKRSLIWKIIIAFLIVAVCIATILYIKLPEVRESLKPNKECTELYPGVFDLGTYTELDYDFAEYMIEKSMYAGKSGCSAVMKTLDNGDVVVGRNLDYYICNYPVYIMRTKQEECYETIGSAMMVDSPFQEYDEVLKKGVGNIAYQVLPFLMMDVMNSEGLYIEVNMRHGETDADGKKLFVSDGTNPGAQHRVLLTSVPFYIASNCADIDEALSYIKTLDIYSDPAEDAWGFGFMMADAAGRHGVLEVSNNRLYWTEGQNIHTNFYIDKSLRDVQKYQIGVGRYDVLEKGYDAVHTAEDMKSLLDSVSYRQVCSDHCGFDRRSEYTGYHSDWTYDYVTDPVHEDDIMSAILTENKIFNSKPRNQITVEDDIWETTCNVIANVSARTMSYEFFENDDYVIKLGFDSD